MIRHGKLFELHLWGGSPVRRTIRSEGMMVRLQSAMDIIAQIRCRSNAKPGAVDQRAGRKDVAAKRRAGKGGGEGIEAQKGGKFTPGKGGK